MMSQNESNAAEEIQPEAMTEIEDLFRTLFGTQTKELIKGSEKRIENLLFECQRDINKAIRGSSDEAFKKVKELVKGIGSKLQEENKGIKQQIEQIQATLDSLDNSLAINIEELSLGIVKLGEDVRAFQDLNLEGQKKLSKSVLWLSIIQTLGVLVALGWIAINYL